MFFDMLINKKLSRSKILIKNSPSDSYETRRLRERIH